MFSVVIPLYNKEQSITNTIQSVLDQTFQDFEIVVVNDGSTDKSVERVKAFDDPRIRIIDKPNGGVSSARNRGIEEAKYEWIAFLDGDDWWEKNFLFEIKEAISKYKDNKIFIGGQIEHFEKERIRVSNEFLPKLEDTSPINYFKVLSKYNSPINSSSVVVDKSYLIDCGLFPIGQKVNEDYHLWIRLCVNESPIFINKHLSNYEKNIPNSASKQHFPSVDFISMINLFGTVEKELNSEDRQYFRKYYKRVVLYRIIKSQKDYSKEEMQKIKQAYNKLNGFFFKKTLDFVTIINGNWLYPTLRKGRGFIGK